MAGRILLLQRTWRLRSRIITRPVSRFRAYAAGANRRNDDFNKEFAQLEEVAKFGGAAHLHQRTATGETIIDAVAQETQRGYDAIFVGASELAGKEVIGGDMLRQLVNVARAPVVIVRGGRAKAPFMRLLTPITGASFSRLGATVAMQYAQVFKSRVTALYVHEGALLSFRSRADMEDGEEFVEEVCKLGDELGVSIETLLGTGRKPESVILKAAHNGDYDLLVMGVLFRSSEQRIYFGPRVREVLRGARCSVALVVPPHHSVPES